MKLSTATWPVWSDRFIGKLMKKKIYQKFSNRIQIQSSLPTSITVRTRSASSADTSPVSAIDVDQEANDVTCGETIFETAWKIVVDKVGVIEDGAEKVKLDTEYWSTIAGP